MSEAEFKHVIALLLEDAKRVQELEPNTGTEARIWLAMKTLDESASTVRGIGFTKAGIITPLQCDGIDKVYHETMVKVLRMEIASLEEKLKVASLKNQQGCQQEEDLNAC